MDYYFVREAVKGFVSSSNLQVSGWGDQEGGVWLPVLLIQGRSDYDLF